LKETSWNNHQLAGGPRKKITARKNGTNNTAGMLREKEGIANRFTRKISHGGDEKKREDNSAAGKQKKDKKTKDKKKPPLGEKTFSSKGERRVNQWDNPKRALRKKSLAGSGEVLSSFQPCTTKKRLWAAMQKNAQYRPKTYQKKPTHRGID